MHSFKSRFKKLVTGSLTAICCICVPVLAAHAEDRVPYDRALITKLPSSSEEVGTAFLKMSGNFPDFSAVVKSSDAYKDLNPLAQEDLLNKSTNRLQNNFMNFNPKKSDLIVRVPVNILFKRLANGEGVLKIRTFPNDPVYLPYTFAKYPIAMIIKDMELFRELRLDRADTDIVYSRLSLSGDSTLLLQLYAIAADDKKTVMLDGVPQYPLLTEIGYIGLLNSQAEQIWAWRNPKLSGKGASANIIDLVPSAKNK